MRKTINSILVAGSLMMGAACLTVGPARAAELGATDEPIKLALFEWTGQHVTTMIAGNILEKMGYDAEFVTAGAFSSATAIADGTIPVGLEVWDNNLGEFYPTLIAEGKIENLGSVGLDAREGWLYPKHLEESCPGLPSWQGLLDCAQVLATSDTFPKGRILAYPADWGTRSAELIAGEGLNFTAVPAGSEGALVAEMSAAIQAKTPLVMMFWAPHWSLATIDADWVDMPDEIVERYSMVPPTTFKAVWPGMEDKWPAAYEFLKNFKISNDIQEPIMGAVDNDGKDIEVLTKEWVEQNEDYWRPMVDAAVK